MIKFEKWQGLGNDFIILENENATGEIAKKLCDRKFGIGADGIFSARKGVETDIQWDFFNSDGTSAQMCGNGIRCFAKYVYEKGLVDKKKFSIMTLKGVVIPEIMDDGTVRVDMGEPITEPSKIPVLADNYLDFEVEGYRAAAISMGNPHCLILTENNGDIKALSDGPKIEVSPIFPEKTNVEFISIINRNKIKVNVWERGCGITLACGTGACASVVALAHKGLVDDKVEVILPGGSLYIEYKKGAHVFMTGDAKRVFRGEII